MRRVRYHEYGGPEVLALEEVAVPTPGPGQILLRTKVVGVNFVDTGYRRGAGVFRRPLPGTLTGDVVGAVVAAGPGVSGFAAGQRVAALVSEDAYAEFVTVAAQWAVAVPDGVDDGTASVLPMLAPVALRVLRDGGMAPGETVLVHSAAGGVGHLAVQLARILGAGTVIGTAGSAGKVAFAERCGADVAIDYSAPDWPERIRAAAPSGVDVVAEAAGGDTLLRSLDVLAPYGRLVTYGAAGGDLVAVPVAALFRLRSVAGFNITAFRAARPEVARAEMAELAALAAAGRIRAAVHATVPLAEAARAHRMLEERAVCGRILLVP